MLNRITLAVWLMTQKQAAHHNADTVKQTITFYRQSPLYRFTLGVWAVLYNLQAMLTK